MFDPFFDSPDVYHAPLSGSFEPNDSFSTASVITEGTHAVSGATQDWFRFEAQAGPIDITMTPTSGVQTLNMELRNAANQPIRAQFTPSGPETISNYSLPAAGTYYLWIYNALHGANPPPDATFDYVLDLDLPQVVAPDGNNSQGTATPLTEGSHDILGREVDWFTVAATPGFMTVTMTELELLDDPADPRDDIRNLNVELIDGSGNVRASFTSAPTETITALIPEADTYYLKVYRAQFVDAAPTGTVLSYRLDIDMADPIAADGNDSRATAQAIDAGTHRISGVGQDWFAFTAPSGMVTLTMTPDDATWPDGSAVNLNLELIDGQGAPIRAQFTASGSESFSHLLPAAGTYYARVYWAAYPDGIDNVPLDYSLSLALPQEQAGDGNDSMATATPLAEGSHDLTGTGVDWYRIDSGPGPVSVTLRHTGATAPDGREMNLNIEVYNAAGEVLRAGRAHNADDTVVFHNTLTGSHFLKVYWNAFPGGAPNGVTLDYGLDIDLPLKSWSVPLDFGPVRNASISVYDIDNDGKDEIFVGTSKALDANGNEVRPAGLIVLEDDGTVKWTRTFAAIAGPDPQTGLIYQTTSVTTAPVFSDVNGDGRIDILVGLGADNRDEYGPPGQPGDRGGLAAVNADGTLLWRFDTVDSFGHGEEGPDGRPEGVYGAPRVFDIDADGVREVLFTSWDHHFYALDGRTGAVEIKVDLHDTAGASPGLADLDRDGLYEIVVPADITDNPRAGLPQQGGILHVLSNYGQANVPGWKTQVFDTTEADYRGKFEEQSLWSSPKVVDLDRDGKVEIVQGTGNFFQDDRGHYVKVWNADGTLRFQLDTVGRVLASPLIADLDGDGRSEIVVATTSGHVHAFSATGQMLFDTEVLPYNQNTIDGVPQDFALARQPIAVDLDADGDLEILVTVGAQIVILDSDGTQISNLEGVERYFGTYAGSPVARDIDRDGRIEILSGGTTETEDQAVIFRWDSPFDVTSDRFRTADYQDVQSLDDIQAFVSQLYATILNREADAAGLNLWTDILQSGVRSGAEVARGFINSQEFISRGTSDAAYVEILYAALFGRAADAGGLATWTQRLDTGTSRAEVFNGFIGSQEFANLANAFGIRATAGSGVASNAAVIVGDATDSSILRGGAGDNTIFDEGTGVAEGSVNRKEIAGQVYRLYGATLGRAPDANGFSAWVAGLSTEQAQGGITLLQAAGGFAGSKEFVNTYGSLTDADFIELLYRNVLGRTADAAGLDGWLTAMQGETAMSRAQVVLGFSESKEFRNRTNAGLDGFMRSARPEWNDVIEGGAGNDQMNGGRGSDIFVFRNGHGGTDTIHGFEPWDRLQLSGFGYREAADALARMSQVGSDVVFRHGAQTITFRGTSMAEMARVTYNLS